MPSLEQANVIWLASYPRSGNTLLRTVLWQCFGLRSTSVYPNDLDGNRELAAQIGHIFPEANNEVHIPDTELPLVKTHELPPDASPAIYVVREGRAATVSLWKFYHEKTSLEQIIAGQSEFGTWTNHVAAWRPWERDHTLMIKYEDMLQDLSTVLNGISAFLGCDIIKQTIPPRDVMAQVGGKMVRPSTDWRESLLGPLLQQFDRINGDMMRALGYDRLDKPKIECL